MSNNKKQPDPLLIDSMAMRYRHDFGLLTSEEQQSIRITMTQLWEEVVGLGFYKPNTQTQMINDKQSSVEWLFSEMYKIISFYAGNEQDALCESIKQQAKAMHKEECKESYYESLLSKFQTFEHYYNETFNNKT